MRRYVVHFPPVIVTSPESETITACSRDSLAVVRAGAAAKQRAQAGERAQHVARVRRAFQVAVEVTEQIRDLVAKRAGLARHLGHGVSVVPTRTRPCHGIAKSTRPSSVCGTRRRCFARKK